MSNTVSVDTKEGSVTVLQVNNGFQVEVRSADGFASVGLTLEQYDELLFKLSELAMETPVAESNA